MTHRDIASAILNNITSGEGISNTRIPLQQVMDEIDTLRARLLYERSQQGLSIEPEYYQTASCIPVICQDISECCGINSDAKVLVGQLPSSVLTQNGRLLINYAGTIDRYRPYRIITGNHYLFAMKGKYVGNKPTLWFDNTRVVLFNPETLAIKNISISAIWTNPAKLRDLDCCSNYDEKDYPAPAGLIDMIIGKITESYIRYFYRMNPLQNNMQIDTQGLQQGK